MEIIHKTKQAKRFMLLLLFFCVFCNAQVSIKKTDGIWHFIVDDKPFKVKGVTFGYDKEVANYDHYFKDLQSLGVNTIRTWATNKDTYKLLNAADKYNIKVMLGIWMRHGRPGMEDDDSFNYLTDTKGMEDMYNNAINVVTQYKAHPALLTWGIGNEVYLNTATDKEKEAYSKFLERICRDIKKIDARHPITSVEAWTFGLDWWQRFVPSIDIYGLNSYGAGVNYLSEELKKRNIDKPYLITEFGVTGEWDIKQTKNDIKLEPTDKDKYNAIVNGYNNWINNKDNNLGVFVFHYANGKDHIAPWLFTHYQGLYRPQYWAIREAYTGETPINYVPEINIFKLPEDTFDSGSWIPVNLSVFDVEQEDLEYSFYYNQRTGSRKRRDQMLPLVYSGNATEGFKIKLPKEDGPIKVYVNAKDTYNNVGIASASIVVKDEAAKAKKYKVPKVKLPFYVYKDDQELPYLPTAYMGNYKALNVNTKYPRNISENDYCIKISYNADANWYGIGFVDPANDWGDILGGYDISGAKTFSFWARASKKNVSTTIGFGLIGKDKPYPDTEKISEKIKLTTKWKKYTIKTNKADLSCIRSGFTLFASAYGSPQDIYIDDVVFEE